STLDCCSLSLTLKSATESFHQRDRLSKKPRFSAGACGATALGGAGDGGKPVGGELCGAVCCGPADVAGPMEPAGDGGSLVCASTAAAKLQASNDSASKAPRTQRRAAGTVMLLLLPGVTATPPWPIHDPNCEQSSDPLVICSAARSLVVKLGPSKVKTAAL